MSSQPIGQRGQRGQSGQRGFVQRGLGQHGPVRSDGVRQSNYHGHQHVHRGGLVNRQHVRRNVEHQHVQRNGQKCVLEFKASTGNIAVPSKEGPKNVEGFASCFTSLNNVRLTIANLALELFNDVAERVETQIGETPIEVFDVSGEYVLSVSLSFDAHEDLCDFMNQVLKLCNVFEHTVGFKFNYPLTESQMTALYNQSFMKEVICIPDDYSTITVVFMFNRDALNFFNPVLKFNIFNEADVSKLICNVVTRLVNTDVQQTVVSNLQEKFDVVLKYLPTPQARIGDGLQNPDLRSAFEEHNATASQLSMYAEQILHMLNDNNSRFAKGLRHGGFNVLRLITHLEDIHNICGPKPTMNFRGKDIYSTKAFEKNVGEVMQYIIENLRVPEMIVATQCPPLKLAEDETQQQEVAHDDSDEVSEYDELENDEPISRDEMVQIAMASSV